MLSKAANEGVVAEVTNMYDHFFACTGEAKAKVTAARLPYFDGDYWPGAAEDMIMLLQKGEDGPRQSKKGKAKGAVKRATKSAAQAELASNASRDLQLMHKLGESIHPMKEDFIMVHMQQACTHCCSFFLSGCRWTCRQCKNFHLCERCYAAEQKLDEWARHPTNSKETHQLALKSVEPLADTKDKDEVMESEFFDTRQAFLSLCQGNHYQYDTLRSAKNSSMMVLYHLHNPTAPAYVTTCNVCHKDIETGQGWRCDMCPDFDICNPCYTKDDSIKHPHKLVPHPSAADRDTQSKEARQHRVVQALFENMGTTLKFSSSFHPQTDGQSEEANSTVLDLLKCYVSEHKATWEHYLPLVEYAYNNTVHTSTGKAPFEIVEGGKNVPPILQTKDKIFEADKYVQNTDEAYRKIKLAPKKTQSKQKKAADHHRRELVFSLGDWVLLRFEKARLRKMKGKERLFPKLVCSVHCARIQMGRVKRPEWQYVEQLKPQKKGQFTCKCKFCEHTWDGGPYRIRAHLLSLSSHGVGPCESVPENIKEVVTRLHVDAKSDGKDPNAYVDALVDDLGGNASLSQGGASGSMSTHASGNAHVSATGTSASKSNVGSSRKKRKGAQGPLASAFSLQARKQVDQALRRFFYAEDIPEWKARSSFFLEIVKAIGQVGPSYVPPTYNALRTTELNDELRKMLELLVHASQCGYTAQCQYPNCLRVKGLFRHGLACRTRASGGCQLCKRMWYLLQLHARACKEAECRVPRCKDLKEHLRRLQQQQELRRRKAVMEMMRQRVAGIST
ncbi:hypothetical protein L7F22_067125 [Adiantum nelumboides]|nr:hypothetical protein [Adiantum nelumboides]